jgi:protein-tyrosine phosphatase
MFSRILMVCVGNICRSPMAEVLLRARLAGRPRAPVIESAGIAALVGKPADPMAIELMRAQGIDLTGHRARQLTPELIRSFDLILVMENGHQHAVEGILPAARGRVFPLGKWGGFEVPDPYRKDRAAFEHAAKLIDEGLASLQARFWT